MSITFLRDHSKMLADLAAKTQARASESPDDFFLQVAAKNQRSNVNSMQQELSLAEAEEIGELVDLRLIGPRADGRVPLDWFLAAMEPLSKAWKYAAYRLRNGEEAVHGVGSDISDALNLKLAGMAYGSTRIFLTGNGSPDLTGECLLQVALTQTFRLLNADQDGFYDAVDAVGGKSAHQIGEFMKALDKGGLAAQFTWQSPKGREHWDGRLEDIARLRALLGTLQEPDRYTETIFGRVAGITDVGRLDLRTEAGKISVRFPLKLTDEVKRLTLTAPARVRVETSRYVDPISKKNIFKRKLLSVDPGEE